MEQIPSNEPEDTPPSITEELRAEMWAAAVARIAETGSLCGSPEKDCTIQFENFRPGDILVMKFSDSKKNKDYCYFRIDEIHWDDLLNTSTLPRPCITGHLIGHDVISDEHIISISGSSTSSGNWFHSGQIEIGLCPYILDLQTRKIHLETLFDVGIIRILPSSNEITVSGPDVIKSEEAKPEITKSYSEEIEKINNITTELGFPPIDIHKTTEEFRKDMVSKKGQFFAKFTSGSDAVGNELIVFNKRSRRVTIYNHFDFRDQRMLQIAYADIPRPIHTGSSTEDDRMREYEKFCFDKPLNLERSHVFRTDQTIVARTISPTSGLDVTTVHPRTEKSSGLFGPPNIQIVGNSVKIMRDTYPYSTMSDNQLMELEEQCVVRMSESSQPEVSINGKVVSTDLTQVSDEILRQMQKKWWKMK